MCSGDVSGMYTCTEKLWKVLTVVGIYFNFLIYVYIVIFKKIYFY